MAACEMQSYNAVRAAIFGKKPTTIQWIILKRSMLHTHTEFRFSERYNRVSFSSTLQEDSNGSRFKDINYSHQKERWDKTIIPITDEEEDLAYLQAKVDEGKLYDLKGQLCHLFKMRLWKPSKKKLWCTKQVARLIYRARPIFFKFLSEFNLTEELRPDQLDMMARYYF